MTKEDWKVLLVQYREDRAENPVAVFLVSLLMLFMAVLVVAVVTLFLYHYPIPIITIAVVLGILWTIYKRI